jgi:predicted RNA binding protein YcfA (HicA-like mRNA interferase family)
MKRNVLLTHLKENGCTLKREGANHSWYINTNTGNLAAVPRHPDIREITALNICKQLGIPKIL